MMNLNVSKLHCSKCGKMVHNPRKIDIKSHMAFCRTGTGQSSTASGPEVSSDSV